MIGVIVIATALGLSACASGGNPQASNSGDSGSSTTSVTSPDTGNGYNDGYSWGIASCAFQEAFYNQSPTTSCAGAKMAPASSASQECGATSEQVFYAIGVPSDDNVQQWEAGCEASMANAVFIGQ